MEQRNCAKYCRKYLKLRYKTYINIVAGLLMGFILITFLYDKPDYNAAIFAISLGLIIGELLVFTKWSKDQKTEQDL